MRKNTKGYGKFIIFVLLCLIAILFLCQSVYILHVDRGYMQVSFIDVGQGDATLISTPTHERILIDGGKYDESEYDLLPYLKSKNIRSLDAVILTHCHDDHYGGLLELIRSNEFNIDILYLHDDIPHNDGRARFSGRQSKMMLR